MYTENHMLYKKSIFILAVFAVIDFFILQMGVTFEIQYHADHGTESAVVYWTEKENGDFSEKNSARAEIKKGKARIRKPGNSSKKMQYRIDFTDGLSIIQVEGVQLYYGPLQLAFLAGENLYAQSKNICNTKSIWLEHTILFIEPENNDSQIYFDAGFSSFINREARKGCFIFCIFTDSFLFICLQLLMFGLQKCREKTIRILKIAVCVFMVLYTGAGIFLSAASGFNMHPDELVTKRAIDYYLTHWIPPDIRSEEIIDTFSVYGYSRLSEWSIYYLLAGKVGYICQTVFHYANYYRVFNNLLLIILCLAVIRKIWKDPWVAVIAVATPQLCYIYSYATSDALDYFCSFMLIYQVASKNSALNRILGRDRHGKQKSYAILAGAGVMSAFIFMGKQNFYVVLLLAFTVFLFRLLVVGKGEKKSLIRDYMFILLVFTAVFMMRYAFDFYHYGIERSKISQQVTKLRAEEPFQSDTKIEEKYFGLGLKDRGVSLYGLFKDYRFGELSYKSFFGVYGYMEYYSGDMYYWISGWLYLLLLVLLAVNCRRLDTRMEVLEYLCVAGIGVLSIVLSVYHSWTNDFQPQGRYLLPMLISMGYLVSKIKTERMKDGYLMLMVVICTVGFYGYCQYGILQLASF